MHRLEAEQAKEPEPMRYQWKSYDPRDRTKWRWQIGERIIDIHVDAETGDRYAAWLASVLGSADLCLMRCHPTGELRLVHGTRLEPYPSSPIQEPKS